MPLDVKRAKEHASYSIARKLEGVIVEQLEKDEPIEDVMTASGRVKGPKFPYCSNPTDLGELGTAVPAFIQFNALMSGILFVMLAFFIAPMATDYRNRGDEVRESWTTQFSPYLSWCWTAGNAEPASLTSPLVPIMVLSLTCVVVFAMPRLRVMQSRLVKRCDLNAVHPNDFTIMVNGLPRTATSEEELAAFFSIPHDHYERVKKLNLRQSKKEAKADSSPRREDTGDGVGQSPGLSDVSSRVSSASDVDDGLRDVVKVVVGYDIVHFSDVKDRIAHYERKLRRLHHPEELLCGGCCRCSCPVEAAEDADCCGCCATHEYNLSTVQREQRYMKELDSLREEEKSFENLRESDLECSGFAFVTFRYQQDLRDVLRYWYESFWPSLSRNTMGLIGARTPLFRGQFPLTVTRASNPSDILWRNLGLPLRTRVWLRSLTIAVFVLALVGSAAAVWALVEWNISYRSEDTEDADFWNWLWALILSWIPGWCVSAINALMWSVVDIAVEKERHSTVTEKDVSALRKTSVFLVLNTAMVYLVVQRSSIHWYTGGGLVENVFVQLLFAAFYDPLYHLVDPFGRLPRWFARLFISSKKSKMSQEKYENLWVGPAFSTHGRFAIAIKNTIVAAIYLPIFPFGSVLSLVALLTNFYADKWLLLRHVRRPPIQDEDVASSSLTLFQAFFTLVPGLSMYFLPPHYRSNNTLVILGIVGTAFNALMAFIVPQYVHEKFLCAGLAMKSLRTLDEDYSMASDYYDAQASFAETYHTSNPVYAALPAEVNPKLLSEYENPFRNVEKGGPILHVSLETQKTQLFHLETQNVEATQARLNATKTMAPGAPLTRAERQERRKKKKEARQAKRNAAARFSQGEDLESRWGETDGGEVTASMETEMASAAAAVHSPK